MVDATLAALAELDPAVRDGAEIAFVTHSIPTAMNAASGPDGGAYAEQHVSVMERSSGQIQEQTGVRHPSALVFCSRSGSPRVPWLEPDINDHLRATQARAVVMVPIGFVSDHMEVIYDLDTEAMATAAEIGLPCVRAATAGTDPRFVDMVRDLLLERAAAERGEGPTRTSVGSLTAPWDLCAPGCCANPRGDRAAIGGVR